MPWCSPVRVLTADELLGLTPGGPKLLAPGRGVLSEVGARGIRGSPGGLLLAAEGLVGSLWWACSTGHSWKLGLQRAKCTPALKLAAEGLTLGEPPARAGCLRSGMQHARFTAECTDHSDARHPS